MSSLPFHPVVVGPAGPTLLPYSRSLQPEYSVRQERTYKPPSEEAGLFRYLRSSWASQACIRLPEVGLFILGRTAV
jgi:hypothetical protein